MTMMMNDQKAVESVVTSQALIDFNALHLDGLRTQCELDAELTQNEIRSLETKLIKLFGSQFAVKIKCPHLRNHEDLDPFPQLRQWLKVVGLCDKSINSLCSVLVSFDDLFNCPETKLKTILDESGIRDEETRRLLHALRNLKKFVDKLLIGDTNLNIDLHWDSWDQNGSRRNNLDSMDSDNFNKSSEAPKESNSTKVSSSSATSSSIYPHNQIDKGVNQSSSMSSSCHLNLGRSGGRSGRNGTYNDDDQSYPATDSDYDERVTSPPAYNIMSEKRKPSNSGDRKFPTTPPPIKRHQTNKLNEPFPLTKSRSHEEHLGHRIEPLDSVQTNNLLKLVKSNQQNHHSSFDSLPHKHQQQRRRLRTEPDYGHTSPVLNSPNRSPPMVSPDQSDSCFEDNCIPIPPRSPRAQGCMVHAIQHRFTNSYKLNSWCNLCEKPMFFGLKCRDCKYRCHRDCSDKVPPSCGLPIKFVDYFKESMKNEGRISAASPSSNPSSIVTSPSSVKSEMHVRPKAKRNKGHHHKPQGINIPSFGGLDSSSNTSSCNSSAPSSPALLVNSSTPPSASKYHSFNFPDIDECASLPLNIRGGPPSSSTSESIDKDLGNIDIRNNSYNNNCNNAGPIVDLEIIETQKSNDSDRTVSGTSGSTSTDSEKTLACRVDSLDSQISDFDGDRNWPRQNSLTLREWDIPYDEIKIGDEIGVGRFGTVYKGNWHGSVAIKLFNMNNSLDDRRALEAFKQELSTFRKTRHENLVLFMGACMKPPHLAIITSLCKGLTLYTHIHLRRDKFNLNRVIVIAQQVCQGMGYLHARGIIHKDLKTKNLFYENGKVIITDFGLCSVTKLCHGTRHCDCLLIPKGWLCYLAPELIRSLRADGDTPQDLEDLPFSKATDIFAFGTVWYELLIGDWPFKGQPPEVIIWQVGKGIKQSLKNLQASKEIKDILMISWAYNPEDRGDFSKFQDLLSRLPKKRLQRSPSHPTYLLRSAESF